MNGPLSCTVMRSGGSYVASYCNEKGINTTLTLKSKHLEWAEMEALNIFPDCESVNGMKRTNNITFPVPETGVPTEKLPKKKKKSDDSGSDFVNT